MSAPIRRTPTVLPTVMPMIAEVSIDWLLDAGVEVWDEETEEDVEGVGISLLSTVDSGRLKACIALVGSKMSIVTTSRYAHAGTAVAELILFGYLSSALSSCLMIRERSNGGHTWILRSLKQGNQCSMKTT